MRQKWWLSDLELGMPLVRRTREGLQALRLEEGRAELLLSEKILHDAKLAVQLWK